MIYKFTLLLGLLLFTGLTPLFADDPPVMSGNETSSPQYYTETNNPVALFPDFTIKDLEGDDIKGLTIHFSSGYQSNQDTLLFTNTSKIEGHFDDTQGALVLLGDASPAEYEAAMRSITYVNNAPLFSLIDGSQREFTISLANDDYFSQDGSLENGHFYEYVSNSVKWTEAKAAASAKTYYGLQGYLCTVTSAAENNFILGIQDNTKNVLWLGGLDSETNGTWRWVTGPESGDQFSTGATAFNDSYVNWYTGQPSGNEYCLQFFTNQSVYTAGTWNDRQDATPTGYIIEYGGMTGDPALTMTTTTTLNINVIPPKAPGGIVDNLRVWFNANSGTTNEGSSVTNGNITSWEGQKPYGVNTTIVKDVAGDPEVVSNSVNFNAVVSFDGDDAIRTSTTAPYTTYFNSTTDNNTAFLVKKTTAGKVEAGYGSATGSRGRAGYFERAGGYQRIDYGEEPTIVYGNTTTINKYVIARQDVQTSELSLYLDGTLETQTSDFSSLAGSSDGHLGFGANPQDFLSAASTTDIAEYIIYAADLSDTEVKEVESYLALKYGISKAGNYFASDGSTIWSGATDNTGYDNDIFGIGRDDASGLNQKVSKSVNAGSILTIALNEDFTSANNDAGRTTHANDLQFLTVANNGAVLTPQVTELDATTGFNIRLAREWKVDATNFAQNISMKFEGYDEDWSIIATSDGDFSSNVTTVGTLNADGEFTTTAASADGTVFTLAKYQEAPGGVTNGISLWIKANNQVFSDLGITGATNNNTIEQWNDQSPYGNHFTQVNTEKPTFLENSLNFNPQVYFNGTKAMNGVSMTGLPSGSDARLMRVVATQTAAFTGNHVLFAHGTATDGQAHGIAGSLSDNSLLYGSWGGENSILSSNSWTLNKPHIIGGGFDGSSTTYLQADGATLTTDADGAPPTWNTVNSRMCIGADIADETGEFWTGNIAEVVVYSANVSASDQQKIDSYLALKYGVTLDQTDATDYLASDGTAIWKAANNTGYTTDIFGIGQDNASGLNQKVSRSVNNTNGPILATIQNFTASNTDVSRTELGNGNFMLMGHNNGTENSFTSSFNGGTNNRSDRVYKVEETGTVGEVYFAIPKTAITFPSGIPVLVASNDLTFNSSDDIVNLADDGTYYWASINPNDEAYLAFATTTPGFTVSETTLTIDENAGTGTFTVVLDVQPSNDVVFDVASDKTEEATVDKATLTFTSANWDTPQTVTVTGVDDDIDRDDTATITVMVKDASSDDPFDALSDQTAGITLTDDDTAGFTVSKIALTIDENAGTGSFTVVLNSEPTSDVVFDVTSDKTDEATIDKSTLTFTSANWDTSQTVTVTGVDDDIDRDDTATITVAVKDASSDDTFDALTDQTVGITLTDDDVAPTVSTSAVFSITSSSVTMGGDMSDKGSADVTETGVVYSSINASPEIGGADVTQDSNGAATGIFSETIGSLAPNTTYNFQAYAINSAGTSYGGVQSFTTKQTQTITFNSLSDKAYGNSDFDPSATASSGLTVSYSSSNTSVATIVAGKIHIVGVGSCTIYADQAGDDTYDVAAQVSQGLNITQKEITVTVDAGQTKVYGDADPTFTYTASLALESGDSFSGVLSRTSGEDVGSYAITIGTLSAGSNYDLTFVSKAFSITQKEITVTVDAGQTKVYGDADPTFTYTTSATLESGDSFTGVLSRTSGESVGSYAILQGTLSAGSNYDLTFVSKDFSITQKAITVTADAGQTKVYGDADPTFTYTTSATLESGDSFTGVLSRTSGESVGSYAILQGTLSAGSNYDLTFVSKDFSITQKAITVTVDAGQTKVYGGADPTFTYTASSVLESGDSFSGVLSRTSGESVGSYAILQGTLSAGSNYDLTFVSKDFSITQKAITVTADAGQTKVYGQADPTFTYTTSATLESGDSFSGVLSRTSGESVGSYAILQGTLSAGSNYDLTFVSKDFAVTQKQITITADAGQTKVYGDADPTFTYTASSALESGDSFSGVLSRTSGESVGSYAILQGTLSAGSNYDLTFVSKDFAVTQKQITITADAGQTKVYGDADPTYTYTASSALESGDSFSGVLSRTSGESVGSYAILQGTLSAGSNYDLTFVSKDFSITQKAITVTVDAGQTKVYGQADPAFTYTTSATLESGDSFTGALSRATGEDVGSYAITIGTLSAGSNYDLTFVSKDFAVTQKQITITADAGQTKVYGGADPTFTYTTSATLESGDSFTGALSRATGEDVGSYAITIGTLSAGSNYDLTFVSKDFSITRKSITVTAEAGQTKVYGESDPTFTYTTSASLEAGDSFTGALSRATGEDVGNYGLIVGTLSAGSNYDLTFESKDFTINKKTITVTAVDKSKTYGEANPKLTFTYIGFVNGDNESDLTKAPVASTEATAASVAGNYKITVAGGVDENYAFTYNDATLTIEKATLTVTATADDKVYDGTTTASITLSDDRISGDMLTINATSAEFEDKNVGEGKAVTVSGIILSGTDANNYQLASKTVSATADITQKDLTVNNAVAHNKVYDGTTDAVTSGAVLKGVVSNDNVELENESVGIFAQSTVGNDIEVTTLMTINGADAANYSLVQPSGLKADITEKELIITGTFTVSDKEYEGAMDATIATNNLNLSGIQGEDEVTLTNVVAAFETASAGNGLTVNIVSADLTGDDADQYSLSLENSPTATASIWKKTATVTGASGITKTYDGNKLLPSEMVAYEELNGILSEDETQVELTGNPLFDLADAGDRVIVQGNLKLTGPKADNYSLVWTDGTGKIEKATLIVEVNNDAKFVTQDDENNYAGVSMSGYVNGENNSAIDQTGLTIIRNNATENIAGEYTDVLEASGLLADNYVFTYLSGDYSIIPAHELLVEINDTSIVYSEVSTYGISSARYLDSDGNTIKELTENITALNNNKFSIDDGVGNTVNFSINEINPEYNSLSNRLAVGSYQLEATEVSGSSTNFNNTIHVTGALTVTTKEVEVQIVSGSERKAFDGDANMDNLDMFTSDLVAGDDVELSGNGSFSQSEAGTDIAYSVTFALQGADKDNYHLKTDVPITGNDGKIAQIELIVIEAKASNKVYDGTTTATITGATLNGAITGDDVTLANGNTGTFVTDAVGNDIEVLTSMTLAGADKDNYVLIQPTGLKANIEPQELAVTNAAAKNKVYDGTTNATIVDATLSGVVADDEVLLENAESGTFKQDIVGTEIEVTTAMTISGVDASNYKLIQPIGITADITTRELTVKDAVAENKVYDGTVNAVVSGAVLDGYVSGDDVILANHIVGIFIQNSVGENIQVVTLMTLEGDDKDNYTLKQPSYLTANITAAELTLSGSFVVNNKEYDGTAIATMLENNLQFNGLASGDIVSLDSIILAFETSNAGTGLEVYITGGKITGSDAFKYSFSLNGAPVTSASINKKELTVTADDKTKEYDGSGYSSFTVSYNGFIDGEDETNLSGALSFTGTATTAINAGTDYTITPGGLSSENYAIIYVDGYLDIHKVDQTITFNPISQQILSNSSFELSAVASSGLTVEYSSSDESIATVSGKIVRFINSGTCTIYANQPGNVNYNAAEQVLQTLTIIPYISGDSNHDGKITPPEIAGDSNEDGQINDGEVAGDTNGDGQIGDDEVAGDTDGNGQIDDDEVAGDNNGDGKITEPEVAGDTDGNGQIDDDEVAGDNNGDGKITEPEVAGDTDGNGQIDDDEVAGDNNGDGKITEPEVAGDTDGNGQIDDDEVAGDNNGDGKITEPEVAGDTDGNGQIDDDEVAGDNNGDGKISEPEVAGDTDGNGQIDDDEVAGDNNGDGKISEPEVAGDTDGNGQIDDDEVAGDNNGDGKISEPEVAGDTDGNGQIDDDEVAGDNNGDGTITAPEVSGDTNGDGQVTSPEIIGDTDGNGIINDDEVTGDRNGDGTIGSGETAGESETGEDTIAGDVNGDGQIGDDEIAGDTDGDGTITAPEVAGDTSGNGQIDDDEVAGDNNGDGKITDPEVAGDTDGNGQIDDDEVAGDNNGDGKITEPEVAGDTGGNGQIDDDEVAGDNNGDGKITDPEVAGDTDGNGQIDDDEVAGDNNGDGKITEPEVAGDTGGNGQIDVDEVAGDNNGDGTITAPEVSGDTNGDGQIGDGEVAGDTDGDGTITAPEIAGDTNGDGQVTSPEIIGDTDGNGIINDDEVTGDRDGDGNIGSGETAGESETEGSNIAGDTNGDGKITDTEVAGDTNGDGQIGNGEIAGDTDGDGQITDSEVAGDTDGNGQINDNEVAGDTNGDGKITDPEVAGDTDGNGQINDDERIGDVNGDGQITAPEIAGDADGNGVINNSETAEGAIANISILSIEENTYENPDSEIYYLIDCEDESNQVAVTFTPDAYATSPHVREFNIEIPGPGLYNEEINVVSEDGINTRTYRIVVEKRFNYNDIVIQKYNNVLLINNNPATNGGYRFTAFNWYKDGVLIGTGQYYSVGDNASDQLDLNAMYSVEIETENGDVLSTCDFTVSYSNIFSLKVAPNPVRSGSTIDVTTSYPTDMLSDLKISVSNLYGVEVMQEMSGSNNSRITLPSSLTPGTYVVSTKAGGVELNAKIIVQ